MLLERFRDAVARHPGRIAITDGQGRSITFADLWARAEAQAARWQLSGLAAGDRALIAVPLGIDLYVSLASLWWLRAAAVLSEPATGLAGLRYAACKAAPKAYLSQGALYGALRFVLPELWRAKLHLRAGHAASGRAPMPEAQPNDPALISFTSGSTGRPKVIVRSQGFLAAQDAALAELLDEPEDDGADLIAFPVFVLANLGKGRRSVLPPWDVRRHAALDPARAAAFMADYGVTRILAPPSALERLTEATPPPRLRKIITGGGPVFPDLVRRLCAWCPGVEVVSAYGSTEAEPIAHVSSAEAPPPEGTGLYAGRIVPAARVRIVEGEIQVAGAHVVQGYLDPVDDAATKIREGDTIWHRTGDAGRLDQHGLWLLGRHGSDVAGLYPFAVEAEARTWPGVRQAALGALAGRPVLAIVGDAGHEAAWRERSRRLGDLGLLVLPKIPMDKRHGSKVDRRALDAAIASSRAMFG